LRILPQIFLHHWVKTLYNFYTSAFLLTPTLRRSRYAVGSQRRKSKMNIVVWLIGAAAVALLAYYFRILMKGDEN